MGIKIAIEQCYMLQKRAQTLSLFSSNEDIDDINTDTLKFGLILHFLSELYTNRNKGKRTLSLRYSNEFGKMFINQCDNWTVLSKAHRNIFERGYGDEQKEKLNPFDARTEEVDNFKLQKQIQFKIDNLLKKKTHNQIQNEETKWKLFNDEEDERNFWLQQFQICILRTLKTLKQNAFEYPLSAMYEAKEAEKKNETKDKYDGMNSNEEKDMNHKAQFFQWEPKQKNQSQSKNGVKVWTVDANGKTNAFCNLEQMKSHLDNTIDAKVKNRTDRKMIFRDPNPWTYTPEQAAELGLLSEVPKDYFVKQKEKKRMEVLNKRHMQRYGQPFGYDVDKDDGTELNVGQVEYHRKGKVTQFTMNDMPKDPDDDADKEIEDMTESEYEQHLRDERGWANWKDDNEKGSGNPYYH